MAKSARPDLLQRLSLNRSVVMPGLHDSLLGALLAQSFRITGPHPGGGPVCQQGSLLKGRETGQMKGFFRDPGKVKMNEKGIHSR